MRIVVPVEGAACLHMQMNDGCEATRDREQIRVPTHRFTIDKRRHVFQAMPPTFGRKRNGIVVNAKTATRADRSWSGINYCNDLCPSCFNSLRCFIAIVIVGRDHHAFAGDYTETLYIRPHGLR